MKNQSLVQKIYFTYHNGMWLHLQRGKKAILCGLPLYFMSGWGATCCATCIKVLFCLSALSKLDTKQGLHMMLQGWVIVWNPSIKLNVKSPLSFLTCSRSCLILLTLRFLPYKSSPPTAYKCFCSQIGWFELILQFCHWPRLWLESLHCSFSLSLWIRPG